MAVINDAFTDSFDHYNTILLLLEKWVTAEFINFPVAGRFGQGVGFPDSNSSQLSVTFAGTGSFASFAVGFAWYVSSDSSFIGGNLYTGSGTTGITLVTFLSESDGTLSVYSGGHLICNSGTGSPAYTLQYNTFQYLEVNYAISGAAGSPSTVVALIQANGQLVASGAGTGVTVPSAGTAVTTHGFSGPDGVFCNAILDDVYMYQTGSASSANFYGDVKVECSFPISDDVGNEWAGNYTDINNPNTNDSADITTSTGGYISTFGMQPIVGGGALQFVNTWVRGTGNIGDEVRTEVAPSGAVGSVLMSFPTSYGWENQPYFIDPNTSSPWTPTLYNVDHFGVLYV